MNFCKLILLLTVSLFLTSAAKSQTYSYPIALKWQITPNNSNTHKKFSQILKFNGSQATTENPELSLCMVQLPVMNNGKVSAVLSNAVYEPLKNYTDEALLAQELNYDIKLNSQVSVNRNEYVIVSTFIPLRKNINSGKVEKLVSAKIDFILTPEKESKSKISMYKMGENSVLANGKWVKLGVTKTGIYKLDYTYMKNIGFDLSSINPRNIHIYGKQNGLLAQKIAVPRDTDLVENAIMVHGENDGVFNTDDYVLFYGQSPIWWSYSSKDKSFTHRVNAYSDTTYYFITINAETGKRITINKQQNTSPDNTIRVYDDYDYHENDMHNEINKNVKSGREWYGEEFDKVTSYDFNFNFPTLEQNSPVRVSLRSAARSTDYSKMQIGINNTHIFTQSFSPIRDEFLADFATETNDTFWYKASSNDLNINMSYAKPTASSIAWLNFIDINARCNLNMHNGQFNFRDYRTVASGKTNKFIISNSNASVKVWDVTNFHSVTEQEVSFSNNETYYTTDADNLKEYVAFDGSNFYTPDMSIDIPNQNLHAFTPAKYIIITHPDFKSAAEKIADIHRKHDGLSVIVITPQPIYNEFSSGMQDIAAIRDFIKCMYDKARKTGGDTPAYVLLLGDASYDMKYRIKNNTNFIPIFESAGSPFSYLNSYSCDDFYGFMDDAEGNMNNIADQMDVAIARLPVQTLTQANQMADKIENYLKKSGYNEWRNNLTFLADDEDGNTYLNSTEDITNYDNNSNLKKNRPEFNVTKLYLDAYQQENTPSGPRYPSVNDAVSKQINSGALVFSYQGHGGESGLAHERVIETDDINSWKNSSNLPLFVTATCEFSRYDDPLRTSAGEMTILNPKGGAIAMLTTVRPVESSQNAQLTNNVFFDNIFERDKSTSRLLPKRMGDIIRMAKNRSGFTTNTMSFTMLGDPALRLAIPQDVVHTSSIMIDSSTIHSDTLKAFSLVTIKGYISRYGDKSLKKDATFDGVVYPTVFDKYKTYTTLANDPGNSYKSNFDMQKNILYKGKATVKNGEFTFSFIMPKDISFSDSKGKISYYANSENNDASGYDTNIVIGGFGNNKIVDDKGPEIQMWMNDTTFISGGLTNQNPVLIARLSDDFGINTSGNGIGHDITGRLKLITDQSAADEINMNNYYSASLNDYRRGELRYPFYNLAEGKYRLNLKVWDVANNSAEDYIDFVVVNSSTFRIDKIFNYPNPFSDETTFSFEHNSTNNNLDVEINIYDLNGKNIKNILAGAGNDDGTHSTTIKWNTAAAPVSAGMYLYRLTVKTKDGKVAGENKKLVIVQP